MRPQKNRRWTVGAGWLALLLCVAAQAAAQVQPVRTQSGLVQGVALPHGLEVYKGIPFAAPPVGRLRWRPPEAPARWQGVRQADRFGAPCLQPASPRRMGPWTRVFLSKMTPSENCLFLNVWTTARRPHHLRPVMVWIYGGGFTSGAGSVEIYDGAALARQGVVVVNFNYRVGPMGFLADAGLTRESPHHSSGNYGLLDQVAALGWVRRNIAAFGGDPHQVTLFGQSAGAASVWLLMQSPLAEGLFQRAITMSAPAVIPWPNITGSRSLAQGEHEGEKFARRLGAQTPAQLRAVPAEKIVQNWHAGRWGPISDGWVLRPGWHPAREVTVINGMVADDVGIGYYSNGPAPPVTPADLQKTLQRICGKAWHACRRLYTATDSQQAAIARTAALQDRARVSLYKWAVRQAGLSPQVYLYYFNHKIPWPQHPQYAVFHSSEVPYAFDNLRLLRRPWQPVDHRIAREISAYWTGFAKTGNPNRQGLPRWPAFRPGSLSIMQLGGRMRPIPLAAAAREHFWMEHLKKPLGF